MSKPLCSIVMATFNREHLLARSLTAYEFQDFPKNELEIVVIDDHSTDKTSQLVRGWSRVSGISTTLLTTCPKSEYWRDCGAILNAGIRASTGQHIILTHPEVIPGKKSVAKCVDMLDRFEDGGRVDNCNRLSHPHGLYAACKVYYMGARDQVLIDSVPWQEEGVLAFRKIPGFYDEDLNGNPDYRHCVADAVGKPGFKFQTWDSWVFGGCSRETWKALGGMWVTQKWGAVDIGFNHRRKKLNMLEWTCPDDDSIVCHQFHGMPGDVETPRIEAEWKKELDGMDINKLKYPEVDELGWGG